MAHIQKRTRNGKPAYVARYLDLESQERSRSFRTEREAERFLIQVEAAKLSDSYLDPAAGRLTFNQWADQWWEVWAPDPDRSPTTIGAADSRLRCHLRPTFGRRRLSEITASSIRQWQYELRGKELGHGTVMPRRSLLNRILQAAEDERLIPANPVAKVPPPKRPVDPEVIFGRVEPRVYTPKQVGQLLAHATAEDRGVLLVLIGTGLRAGELCGLRGARVDLRRRRLEVATVRYDAGRFGGGYKPRPRTPPARPLGSRQKTSSQEPRRHPQHPPGRRGGRGAAAPPAGGTVLAAVPGRIPLPPAPRLPASCPPAQGAGPPARP